MVRRQFNPVVASATNRNRPGHAHARKQMNTHTACKSETLDGGRILLVMIEHGRDNLVTPELLTDVVAALGALQRPGGPEVAILCGQGPVFSKGFDVDVIRCHASPSDHRNVLVQCNDLCTRVAECSRPVIAAINGACLGAGLELALACHFRLCMEKVRLGLPELSQGLLPGLGGIHRLVRLVGAARALEAIALGRFLTAEEALHWGLVHRVLPREGFLESVVSFAKGILAIDQQVVREAIRLVRLAATTGDEDCAAETIDSIVRSTSRS